MQVSELTGAQLALWVAQCDPRRSGIRWQRERDHWVGFGRIGSSPEFPCWLITDAGEIEREKLRGHLYAKVYAPHEDWAQAGPIIERENIGISPPTSRVHRNGGPNAGWGACGLWTATTWHKGANGRRAIAWHESSPLIAAMRCFVISKFGDEVPDDPSPVPLSGEKRSEEQ